MALNIEKMEIDDLRALARKLNLEFPPSANRQHLQKLIEKEAGPESKPSGFVVPNRATAKKVYVLFPEERDKAKNHAIAVTVNGDRMEIQRGKRTAIPDYMLEALNNAVERHFQWTGKTDEGGAHIYEEVNVQRFQFNSERAVA